MATKTNGASTLAPPITSLNGPHGNIKTAKTPSGKVHPQLATPTDLTPAETKAVADCVNPLVADHFALYIKYKNFHWHLAASHFRDYHLLFDEHADDVFEAIDVLAERVRKVGGTTVRSLSHILSLTSIEDDNNDFVPPAEMVRMLVEDNKASGRKLREAIKITEDARDYPTSNILQDILDHTERRIWFLFEVTTGAEFEN